MLCSKTPRMHKECKSRFRRIPSMTLGFVVTSCYRLLLWLFVVRKDGEFILHTRYFRILGFDHFCTSFLYPVRWSPYFSWCGGTCKDQYLSILGHTMRYLCDVNWGHLITCLVFQKFSSVILSSNAILFDRPITQAWIYFTSLLAYAPLDVVWAHLYSCVGLASRAWLLACPNTLSFCLSSVHFLQHFIFISVYHILQFCIFHNVSVVIPLMIWVSICYVACVGMNAL